MGHNGGLMADASALSPPIVLQGALEVATRPCCAPAGDRLTLVAATRCPHPAWVDGIVIGSNGCRPTKGDLSRDGHRPRVLQEWSHEEGCAWLSKNRSRSPCRVI